MARRTYGHLSARCLCTDWSDSESMTRRGVVITGGGFTNKGSEAMVLTVAEALRGRLPDLDIYVTAPFREARAIRDAGLIPTGRGHPKSPVSHLCSAIRARHVYRNSVALIDVGGYQFGDPWGTKRASQKLRMLKGLAMRGAPIFFMPQAWGPFSSQELGNTTRQIVDAATVCFVRDMTSVRMMRDLLGADHDKIRFAHDIAWNFRGAEPSVGKEFLKRAGVRWDDHALTVGVTPNLRVCEKTEGTGAQNQYVRSLLEIVRHLCSAHNAQVILVGHELSPPNARVKDDRTLCRLLLGMLDGKWPVGDVDTDMSAADVKSTLGCCDLLLASRYHALIAALSQGIPVAAIGWSHKYEELLREVSLSANVLSVRDPAVQILASIDSVIERVAQSRALIQSRLPVIKASAAAALEVLVSGIEAVL